MIDSLQVVEKLWDRLYQGSQADMTREQQARAAQLGRQYGSSQADIAREQSAREAMFGRMGTGAEGISNIQDLYDRRRMAGVGAIGETGAAYEDLAGRTLQDRINRYEFEQRSPYDRLNFIYVHLLLSIGGMQQSKL